MLRAVIRWQKKSFRCFVFLRGKKMPYRFWLFPVSRLLSPVSLLYPYFCSLSFSVEKSMRPTVRVDSFVPGSRESSVPLEGRLQT